MTYPIRVGAQLIPQHTTYHSYAEAVCRVEEMGVDSIWTWDHFFPLYGNPRGNHFEGWTLLTAIAALTKRAEIGCLVTCNSYRNPALLSNMAKTVDHIGNGRLILGIGAGWFERDYKEYGYDFEGPGARATALEEALQTIQHRWKVDAPLPIRHPIPIMIGGSGEKKMLRLVATYATMWHCFNDPKTYRDKVRVLHEWCEEVGRDPQEIEHVVAVPAQGKLDTLDEYLEAGATYIILGMGVSWNYDLLAKLLQWRDERNSSRNVFAQPL